MESSAAEAAAPNAAAKRKATFRSASRPDSELAKAVAKFCDGDAPEKAFPASLCGAERAALHQLARRAGLRAVSAGSEAEGTRVLTLHRPSSEEERLRAVEAAAREESEKQAKKKQRDEPEEPAAAAASGAGSAERDPEQDTEYDSQEEEAVEELDGRDLHELLSVPVGANASRLRAAYHRMLLKCHPAHLRWTPSSGRPRVEAYRETKRRFRQIAIAYRVLQDPERARIYGDHGVKGLKRSEAYQEENVFELDPWESCDDFFEGEDPEDREYFLLNGNQQLSCVPDASARHVYALSLFLCRSAGTRRARRSRRTTKRRRRPQRRSQRCRRAPNAAASRPTGSPPPRPSPVRRSALVRLAQQRR